VDQDRISFCRFAIGWELTNCPGFIHEWMAIGFNVAPFNDSLITTTRVNTTMTIKEDAMSQNELAQNPLIAGLEEIRSSWGWFLGVGMVLMIIGAACIVGDVTATFATVLIFGWVLLISGICALVHAFRTMNWSGFFLYLLSALFRGFTGYLLIRYPLAGPQASH
jgi:hypothetical protein